MVFLLTSDTSFQCSHWYDMMSLFSYMDEFHSIFHHRNWRAKVSCDVDINQSAGCMV